MKATRDMSRPERMALRAAAKAEGTRFVGPWRLVPFEERRLWVRTMQTPNGAVRVWGPSFTPGD